MTDEKTFMMGKFPAALRGDRRYCRNHMWCQRDANDAGVLRFGFTSYAVRLMQDVYFLDWTVNAGDALKLKQQFGHIETSKAVSDLFAPLAGTLVAFNPELLNDPTPINTSNYDKGWLFTMRAGEDDTLSMEEYFQFLEANWEKTQNMLKGHM